MYSQSVHMSNMSCVVDNFTSMTCAWTLNNGPLQHPDLNVTLTWTNSDGVPDQPCPEQTENNCRWPADKFRMGSVYMMMVTVFTVDRWGKTLDSAASQFSFDTYAIVKLPPVQDLQAVIINSTYAQLTWQQENIDNIECKVQYDCMESNENCKTIYSLTSGEVDIGELSPLMLYEWLVSCRPNSSEIWSEPVSFIHTMPSSSPLAGPMVHPGSYTTLPCNQPNCRQVKVYWKNSPSQVSSRDIKRYQIVVRDMSTGHWDTLRHNFTNQTSHTVSLRQDRDYTITINFCTKNTCQDFSNPIMVVRRGQGIPCPEGVTVELVSDVDPPYLNLTWKPVPSVISYTIFWCKGSNKNCQSTLNWKGVSRRSSQYNLTLPALSLHTFREYQVGVSAEAVMEVGGWRGRRSVSGRSHTASSGIAWSPCLYGQPSVPTYVLENVHQSQSITADSVDVAWDKLTCLQTPSTPTGVLLVYCLATGEQCTGPISKKMVPGVTSTASLTGLKSGETYLVTAYAMTRAGKGPPSEPIKVEVKQDLTLLITILLSFGILLLLLLVTFFIVWGVRVICTSKGEDISVPGEEKLITEEEGIPPPPLNPPPEGRSSYRNGSYRQRQDEKEADNVQLLKPDFYKEAPSQRSSAPIRLDNCYMVPPTTKPISRHSKRHSENNNKPPMVTGLEAKSEDSFPLLDFTDEGIPRERLSSFKGHLVTKDYGFAVKGQIDYEDLLNAQLEKEKTASVESIAKNNKLSDKSKQKKHIAGPKYHKKNHSVSFSDDEKVVHDSVNNQYHTVTPPLVAGQPSPGVTANKERPSKKERRWSKGRPDSDGHKYSDSGRHSPRRISPDKRLSRDCDFPTPPPTPPLYLKRENTAEHRFSGHDFPAPPPPPPLTFYDRQQTPEIRFSGHFSFPTPPPPPLEPEEELKPDSIYPNGAKQSLPKQMTPQQKFPPSPNEMQSNVYSSQAQASLPSPKQRTADAKPDGQHRFPPAPNEMHTNFKYPLQHGFIPAPKERKIDFHPEIQSVYAESPREMQQDNNQAKTPIPSPKQRTKDIKSAPVPHSANSTVVEPRSPISPDRLSKTLSQADPDSTLDISFLLGDLLGGGMTVRTTENNTNEVQMRPKPRQNIPAEHTKVHPSIIAKASTEPTSKEQTAPDSPEVVMRQKPHAAKNPSQGNSKGKLHSTETDSQDKSNPPEVAPKPVFIKTKDSVYGKLQSSLTEQESQPISSSSTSSSQNPNYDRYA